MIHSEANLARQVAQYLQLQHPGIIYRFDLAADLKLSIGQASRHKRLHPTRGYPDLWIAAPRGDYHGLFLEIKALGTRIWLRNGQLTKNPHIREQMEVLKQLDALGYGAVMVAGFCEAQEAIDSYLAVTVR